jgi:hypothetical protein
LINSTRRSEYLADDHCGNYTDFIQDGSRSSVADDLDSEDLMLNSPSINMRAEIGLSNNVFAIVS